MTSISLADISDDDPNTHLATCMQLCDMVLIEGAIKEVICMKLFSFSRYLKRRNYGWEVINSEPSLSEVIS